MSSRSSRTLRFKLYDCGGLQALLIDAIAPGWKRSTFAPNVFLSGLLTDGLRLSETDRREALARAKAAYGFDSLYTTKLAFERDGRAVIQAKVDAILKTDQTLVTISFGGEPGARLPMSFTPFGVTAVTPRSAIYDRVPIAIRFPSRSLLRMKQAIPVLVDRQARTVTFAVSSPPSAFAALRSKTVDTEGFTLTGEADFDIEVEGNHVRIEA